MKKSHLRQAGGLRPTEGPVDLHAAQKLDSPRGPGSESNGRGSVQALAATNAWIVS